MRADYNSEGIKRWKKRSEQHGFVKAFFGEILDYFNQYKKSKKSLSNFIKAKRTLFCQNSFKNKKTCIKNKICQWKNKDCVA